MNSFVRCLVMLTYTLVIYRLRDGLVCGYNYITIDSPSERADYITKEHCENQALFLNDNVFVEGESGYYSKKQGSLDTCGNPLLLDMKKIKAMCVPSKDL